LTQSRLLPCRAEARPAEFGAVAACLRKVFGPGTPEGFKKIERFHPDAICVPVPEAAQQ
jgi:hypothetical protein